MTIAPMSAAEPGKLLPPDTDMVLSLNLRQFLNDHKATESVQWFLDHLRGFMKDDALGLDLARDVDRVVCAIKAGAGGFGVVLVEGRFEQDRLRAALRQLSRELLVSFQVARVGEHEVWQVVDGGAGVHLVLLDPRTLAITSSKKPMDELLARAAGLRNGGLSESLKAMLDSHQKDHLSFVMKRLSLPLEETTKLLLQEVSRQWPGKDSFAPLLVKQIASAVQGAARDLAAAGVALSVGKDELRLRLDLEATSPRRAWEMQTQISAWNFVTALALKTIDMELSRDLADIIRKERVLAKDATLTLQVQVPHDFIRKALTGQGLGNGLASVQEIGRALADRLVYQVTSIPIWGPARSQPPDALEVAEVRDIAYRSDPGADAVRHRLDLFYPKGKKDFPVVVVVHGGAWIIGDNRCCGLMTSVGHFLASRGVGAVLPNYRLSPWVRHPEHIKDVARAVAWVREHVGEYGGNPERLCLAGHSAGGHLVALLAMDETYLQAEGLKPSDIKGVIAVSGIYRIPSQEMLRSLDGPDASPIRLDQLFPLRGDNSRTHRFPIPGLSAALDVFGPVFGDDPKDRIRASPLTHVRAGAPPFLIMTAETDLPTLAGTADELHQALLKAGCEVRRLKVDNRNHSSVFFSAIRPEEPAARAMLELIQRK
jgi:acetyl esterase/lipase